MMNLGSTQSREYRGDVECEAKSGCFHVPLGKKIKQEGLSNAEVQDAWWRVSLNPYGRNNEFWLSEGPLAPEQVEGSSAGVQIGSQAQLVSYSLQLEELRQLPDNWDGEGAPAISSAALESAKNIVSWALNQNLEVFDVDSDVLGGVAVWLGDPLGRRVWISCKNGGQNSVTTIEADKIQHLQLNDEGKLKIVEFLNYHHGQSL